jgi:hypothetical protein
MGTADAFLTVIEREYSNKSMSGISVAANLGLIFSAARPALWTNGGRPGRHVVVAVC